MSLEYYGTRFMDICGYEHLLLFFEDFAKGVAKAISMKLVACTQFIVFCRCSCLLSSR